MTVKNDTYRTPLQCEDLVSGQVACVMPYYHETAGAALHKQWDVIQWCGTPGWSGILFIIHMYIETKKNNHKIMKKSFDILT